MFKAIKSNKIIAISDTDQLFPCLIRDEVVIDTDHTCADYEKYNGEYLLKSEIPAPTKEEQKEKRALAYQQDVDPITSHIQRLRDDENPDEEKIEELIEERNLEVEKIKARYPYPVE